MWIQKNLLKSQAQMLRLSGIEILNPGNWHDIGDVALSKLV